LRLTQPIVLPLHARTRLVQASLGLQQLEGNRSLRTRRIPSSPTPHVNPKRDATDSTTNDLHKVANTAENGLSEPSNDKVSSKDNHFFASPEPGLDKLEEEAVKELDSELTSMFLNIDPQTTGGSDPYESTKSLKPRLGNLERVDVPPGDSLSSYVRHAMRSIPQSVVVVTSTDVTDPADPTIKDRNDRYDHDRYRGMTISSFNTVSLDPFPIVSFNVKVPSATHDAITNSGKFIIHTLSTSADAIKIADHFSKGRGQAAFHPEEHVPFRTTATGPHEPPLLASKELINPVTGTITFPYAFKCKLGKSLRIHDHVIITAEIVRVLRTPRGEALDFGVPHGKTTIGLSYADGGYRQGSYPAKDPSAHYGVGNMPSQLEFYLRKLRELVDPGRNLSKEDLIRRIGKLQLESARQRALKGMALNLKGKNDAKERGSKVEKGVENGEGEEGMNNVNQIAALKRALRESGVDFNDLKAKIEGRGLERNIRLMKSVKRRRYSDADAGSE
jgi:flavin reductase (DIM6/NTAB) family NADH-FMN oxidoreductase RutF